MVAEPVTAVLTASICLRVRGEKRSEAISALAALVERLRDESGCRSSRILADVDDVNMLVLVSEWEDFESVSAYFDSPGFHIFRGLRILLRDEPYVVLDEVSARVTKTLQSH